MGTLSAVLPILFVSRVVWLRGARASWGWRPNGRSDASPLFPLSTNAIKDTVSVLYWYEELSRRNSGNFWNSSSELFFVFLFFYVLFLFSVFLIYFVREGPEGGCGDQVQWWMAMA